MGQMVPMVSIIVTVYKRIEFLEGALRSALSQTYPSYEVIVADDSDSPEIRSLVGRFGPAIRYFGNNPTLGVALSLRAAVAMAKGKYIAILNDDDEWEPKFLENLVPPLEADSSRVLAFCDHWIMRDSGTLDIAATGENTIRYGRSELQRGDVNDLASLVLEKNGVPLAMGAVFRKEAIDFSHLVREVAGAYDFWISCLLASGAGRAWYEPTRLTKYRVHSAMETGRRAPDKNTNMVFIYSALLRFDSFRNKRELLRRRLAQSMYSVGRDLLWFGCPNEARRYFSESMAVSPNARSLAFCLLTLMPMSVQRKLGLLDKSTSSLTSRSGRQ